MISVSCVFAVHASPHTAVMSRNTPVAEAWRPPALVASASVNMAQPMHTPTAASTCRALYLAPMNTLLMSMVGRSLEDLATTLTGKETCAMAALPAPCSRIHNQVTVRSKGVRCAPLSRR